MVLISPGQRLLHRLTDSILEQLPATFLPLRSTRGRTEASPAGRRPPPGPATLTDTPQENFRTLSVTFRWLSHFSSTSSAVTKCRSFRTFLHRHARTPPDVITSPRAARNENHNKVKVE